MDIKSVLTEIENYDGEFPEKKLNFLIENKERAIPELLKVLENTNANVTEIIERDNFFGHVYATYLLAQFREKKAYPLLHNLMLQGEDISYELFGELITEDLHRVLASLSCGDIGLIKEIIENEEVDEYTRNAGLRALIVLFVEKEISRKEIIEYFDTLYSGKLEREYSRVWTALIKCTNELHPGELMDKISKAYDDDLIALFDVSIEEVKDYERENVEDVLKNLEMDKNNKFIKNTISDMKTWACFRN